MKTIQVSDENHKEIKMISASEGKSIMSVINEILAERAGRLKEVWDDESKAKVAS